MTKEVVVFGMGRFGRSVAKQLEANGCKVVAIDCDEDKVHQISEYVTYAVCANVTDENALEELGITNYDTAIIAMGHNLEAAILITIWCKEHGVEKVVAKAYDEIHGKILRKVGADEVIFPEKEMGKRLANRLTLDTLKNAVEITDDYSLGDLIVPEDWIGKDLKTLQLREKHKITVIAIKRGGVTRLNPAANELLEAQDTLVILGANDVMKKLTNFR